MIQFEIRFKHTEETTYKALVSANSKDEAEKKFQEDPFGYVTESIETQGLDIEVENIDSQKTN